MSFLYCNAFGTKSTGIICLCACIIISMLILHQIDLPLFSLWALFRQSFSNNFSKMRQGRVLMDKKCFGALHCFTFCHFDNYYKGRIS